MKSESKNLITISIDGALLDAAKIEADAQNRSFSAQVELWIEESLEVAGKPKRKLKL